jgi:hypothetical protein
MYSTARSSRPTVATTRVADATGATGRRSTDVTIEVLRALIKRLIGHERESIRVVSTLVGSPTASHVFDLYKGDERLVFESFGDLKRPLEEPT